MAFAGNNSLLEDLVPAIEVGVSSRIRLQMVLLSKKLACVAQPMGTSIKL